MLAQITQRNHTGDIRDDLSLLMRMQHFLTKPK